MHRISLKCYKSTFQNQETNDSSKWMIWEWEYLRLKFPEISFLHLLYAWNLSFQPGDMDCDHSISQVNKPFIRQRYQKRLGLNFENSSLII